MTVASALFDNPVFKEALTEIEALGFRAKKGDCPRSIRCDGGGHWYLKEAQPL